jgi:Actinobacteria/chloroflexi VLRF1 release factor
MTADRVVRVSPERLPGWVERFAARHGAPSVDAGPTTVTLVAADGTIAALTVPFPTLPDSPDPLEALVDHARRDRLVGALLVRRGGYATGVFVGRELRTSKVGHGYVQGRTKAGGWSQQRFARRRQQQAERAYAEAAEAAYAVLFPVVADLEAVVGGGDRSGVEAVLADPRLAPVRALLTGRVLPTPDPRLDVLRRFGDSLREVEIRLGRSAAESGSAP